MIYGINLKIFNTTVDKFVPIRPQTRKEIKKSSSPWITIQITKNIKTRRKLYKKYLSNQNASNWLKFSSYRNKLNSQIAKAKKNYFNFEIVKAKSDTKQTWKVMNQIVNLKFNSNSNNEIREINDESNTKTCDAKKISDIFNDFFTNVGKNLSKSIDNSTDGLNTNFIKNSLNLGHHSFFLNALTPYDVKKYISELNPQKATKLNFSPTKIIKLSTEIISPIISDIFNKCIKEAVFPNSLKSAEIRPIFKKGNKLLTSNYRPISILSPFSKIFEKHICTQLTNFMTKHNILHASQFGFRTNSSTEMAVSQIIEEITNKFQNGEYTCSIFLDLAKAFDTVDHEILMNKLCIYGVRGLPAKLLQNYLSHRTQQTIINNTKSNIQTINCGIPQGSILGPLLFNIYINDIIHVSNFSINLFADDACLLLSSKDPKDLESKVNIELDKINQWRKFSRLSINFSKSFYMIFFNKKQNPKFNITMDGNTLIRTNDFKYLGIVIDHKLKWKKHISQIVNKITKVSYMLTKIRHYIDLNSLKLLYFSLVHSHIIYCLTTWGGAPRTTLQPLINLQKKVIRIITKSPFDHPSAVLFSKLKIMPFDQLYKYHLSLLMHRIHNNKFTGKYNLIRLDQSHKYNTRSSIKQNYQTSFNRLNVGLNSFKMQGPKCWNQIPLEIKILPIHLFKRKLKEMLLIILNEEIT